jgi:hypothetical protein
MNEAKSLAELGSPFSISAAVPPSPQPSTPLHYKFPYHRHHHAGEQVLNCTDELEVLPRGKTVCAQRMA